MEESNNEARKRHDDLYFIEYVWIPQLVDDVNEGKVSWGILRSFVSWHNYLKDAVPELRIDWNELREETFRIDENRILVVYVFPDPAEDTEAAFGAVFVNNKTGVARYFTLEQGHNGLWFIGGMSRGKHSNYGIAAAPTLDYFLKWVIDTTKND